LIIIGIFPLKDQGVIRMPLDEGLGGPVLGETVFFPFEVPRGAPENG